VRIALVETKGRGGLLHYAVQLADALARRGHSVDVLVPRGHELQGHDGEARLRPVLSPDVNVVRRQLRNRGLYQLRRGLIAVRLSTSMLKAVVMLRRGHYDAVILQWDVTFSIFAAASALLQRLPKRPVLAFILHNVRPFNRWGGDDIFVPGHMRRLSRLLPKFDVVLVHGEQSLKEYTELYPPTFVAVVPHGDERLFGDQPLPPAEEERVLFFGDWSKIKGLPVLMEAFELLLQRRPQAKLTIAGTPSPADFDDLVLRRWAAAHPDSVTLVDGYVPVDEVRPLFASARLVCTPYIAGYQSGVVHLSMTMGRAVVTSDVGDLGTAVGDGEAGLVVPVGDAAALAVALERVLTEPGLAEKLGAEGRRRAQTASSWEVTAGLVEEALGSAAAGRVQSGPRTD
jgi:glycosyltransferase involved in cell wall biosynthesis